MDAHRAMMEQVAKLASNPAVQRLMESPELLESIKERDPMLKQLLDQSPAMAGLLAPEKLRAVLGMASNPARLRSEGAQVFGALDITDERKALLQLDAYTRQLQHEPRQPGPQGLHGSHTHPGPTFAQREQPQQGAGSAGLLPLATSAAALPQEPPPPPRPQPLPAPPRGLGVTEGVLPQRPQQRPAAMQPPNQPAPFFNSAYAQVAGSPGGGGGSGAGAGAGGADYQGGFSFVHSERELPLHELPAEVQQQLLAAPHQWPLSEAPGTVAARGGDRPTGLPGAAAPPPSAAAAAAPSLSAWQQDAAQSAKAAAMASTRSALFTAPAAVVGPAGGGGGAGGGGAGGGSGEGRLPVSTWSLDGDGTAAPRAGGAVAGNPAAPGQGSWRGHGHAHGYTHGHGHGHGATCCADHSGGGGGGGWGPGGHGGRGGAAGKLSPRDYYEPVEPNTKWRPQQSEDGCASLYRRAYSRHCDLLFFPPFFALAGLLLVGAPGLPFWLLAALLAATAVCGSYGCAVVLGGMPRSAIPASRVLLSLIATCEVVYPAVYGWRVLPYWYGATSAPSLALMACFLALPLLHVAAATSDPGFVTGGGPDTDPAHPAKGDHDAAAAAAGQGTAGQGPGERGGAEAAEAGGAAAGLRAGAVWCHTCSVARPLRAKHCQFCDRCVRRFDHHCPAIGNCVGEGNERSFAAWLLTMWLSQLLLVYVALSYLLQRHLAASGAAAASSAPDTGPAAVAAAVAWGAGGPERALVLLAGLQALCLLPSTFLAARQAYCILANLTANELINRQRYAYLKHELGGYCNRFDRGPALNCLSFWLERDPDWWAQFDAGDRKMRQRGVRPLPYWSVGRLLSWLDGYNERRAALKQAVLDLRLQKAMKSLEVRAHAAAAAQAAAPSTGMTR